MGDRETRSRRDKKPGFFENLCISTEMLRRNPVSDHREYETRSPLLCDILTNQMIAGS